MNKRYLEDFAVGQTFGSRRLRVDKEQITAFAAEQSAHREGDRVGGTANPARPRRQGDRMMRRRGVLRRE